MIDQGLGGDIVYIVSKNAVFAGPNNIAYSAAKADQAHQVRLLAAELGEHGIRVNGVNPDGVVRGSGIFAGGWGAKRAAVYGVPEEELGAFYAQRTLLKREVLPEHVANAVAAHHAPTSSATPPGCTSPSTPASPPPSCADRMAARSSPPSTSAPRAAGSWPASSTASDRRTRRRCTGSPTACVERDGHLRWDIIGLVRRGARRARRLARRVSRRRVDRHRHLGAWTTACSTPTGELLAEPDRLPRRPHRRRRRRGARPRPARRALRASTDCSTCRSTPSTSSPPSSTGPLWDRRRARRAAARPARLLAHRRAAHRGHQRVDHRAPRRPHRRLVAPSSSTGSASPPGCCRRSSARHGPRPLRPTSPRARAARHVVVTTVGSHDTASAVVAVPGDGPTLRLHRQRHLVARRRSSSTGPVLTDDGRERPTSPTRAASTAASGSSATSAGCGCSRSRCGRGPRTATHRPRHLLAEAAALPDRRPDHRRRRRRVHPARATCPAASRAAAGTARRRRTRPRSSACIVDSLAAAYARDRRAAAALAGPAVDVDPHRRRRLAERAALPAHRRPRRPPGPRRAGRGHRARQRPRPGPRPRRGARLARGRPGPHRRRHPLRRYDPS